MDIQTRKIQFVQEFLRLKNEKLIEKFENLLNKEKKKSYEEELKPMTIDSFIKTIDKAEEDSKEGRLNEANKLLKDIDTWT